MWLSVSFAADSAQAELLADALMSLGALSVSLEDADAGTEQETPQFGEPGCEPAPLWAHSRVIALFEADANIAAIAATAAVEAGLVTTPDYEISEIAEQNWVQLTQAQFEPIRINDRLWIVPSWHTAPNPGAVNLVLDPGMAFGTGSHPTTRLCLEWLCEHVQPGDSLIDYGCGSGILAIAAAKLGAGPVGDVVGVDIDDNALRAAADNAARNEVALVLMHSNQVIDRQFDIVVANILTNPLCVMAPLLATLAKPGARIGLSGILATQTAQVQAAYRPAFELQVAAEREGWVLLEGTRR